MLARRHITEHRCTMLARDRSANGGRDMVITRSDIGRQGAKSIKGRFLAEFQLLRHVLVNELHWHIPQPLMVLVALLMVSHVPYPVFPAVGLRTWRGRTGPIWPLR